MKTRCIVSGVVQRGDEIVLGKKAKGTPPYPDVWHTPGGGAEDQEKAQTLFDAGDFDNEFFHNELKREIREELGLEVRKIKNIIPEFREKPREGETKNKEGEMTHYYFLEYLCEYKEGTLTPGDDLAEARWVRKSDLKDYVLTPPSKEMYRELGWLSE